MMDPDKRPLVTHWTTDALDPRERCAIVKEALGKAIIPLNLAVDDPACFAFRMSSVELDDGVSLLRQSGSAHRSMRGRRELARSGDHTYHFMINLRSSWNVEHRTAMCLQPGEGVFTDSNLSHDLGLPYEFEVVHIKMSEAWVRRHVSRPEALIGHRIALDGGMSRALNLYAAQLSPQSVMAAPLHQELMASQFGAMLSMAADEHAGVQAPSCDDAGRLCEKVRASMQQRLDDPLLDAADVAAELRLPQQMLLDALSVSGQTFAGMLMRLRAEVALRMLKSAAFRDLPREEIAARTGFLSVRALNRALR